MSYGMAYPVVARAEPSARAMFIRRTYGHLAGAILAFAALETVLLHLPGVDQFVASIWGAGRMGWLLVLGAFMVVSWLANSWAHSDTSRGVQYLGLGLYVLAEAAIFLPLLYIADRFYPGAIQSAGIMTLAVFVGLTAAVFLTRQDFSYLRTILAVGGMLAFGFIIAAMFFKPDLLGLVFCFAMIALMCGYILYDTSNVLHHYRTDQHVAASLALFSSVALLFWYVLRVVMMNRRN